MHRVWSTVRPWVLALLVVAVPACGGGSSGGGGAPAVTLSGTAAVGAPIADADIVAKDRNGTAVNGTTGSDGTFSLDVTGLTAPFLLRVTTAGGDDLFSVGSQTGIVALTPLTDMVVRSYYRARGLDIDTVFASLSGSDPVPTVDEIRVVAAAVRDLVAQWIEAQGLDPEEVDLMTIAFAADGSGFDAVLDMTSVTDDGTTTTLTIDDGADVTQVTEVVADDTDGSLSASTVTTDTNSSATSESVASTLVPFGTQVLAALSGVNATLEGLKTAINTHGADMTAALAEPFLADDLLHEGTNKAQQAAQIASFARQSTIVTLLANKVFDFDSVNEIIDVEMVFVESGAGGTNEERLRMAFKKVGGSWLMYGDRRIARFQLDAEMEIVTDPNGTTQRRKINVDFRPAKDAVNPTSVTVHCPDDTSFFNNTAVPHGGTETVTYEPTSDPADNYDVVLDTFFAQSFPGSHPAPGTRFELTFTPMGGGAPVTYETFTRGTTTETVTLTTTPGGTDVADVVGQTVQADWSLPTTFRILRVNSSAHIRHTGSGDSQIIEANEFVGNTTQTATYDIPTHVNGDLSKPVDNVTINLSVEGPNGERIIYLYSFR